MNRKWYLLIALTLILSACGTIATPVWQGSNSVAVAQVNTPIPPTNTSEPPTETPLPTPTLTATPLPPTATPLPPTPTDEPEPEPAAGGAFVGDAANGEVLFNTFQAEAGFACATCHNADSEIQLIGPGLLNVSTRAETRVEGLSAVEYMHTSIVDPGAYVVEGFPDGLMPQNWAEIYSEADINDLIAYLLTL